MAFVNCRGKPLCTSRKISFHAPKPKAFSGNLDYSKQTRSEGLTDPVSRFLLSRLSDFTELHLPHPILDLLYRELPQAISELNSLIKGKRTKRRAIYDGGTSVQLRSTVRPITNNSLCILPPLRRLRGPVKSPGAETDLDKGFWLGGMTRERVPLAAVWPLVLA